MLVYRGGNEELREATWVMWDLSTFRTSDLNAQLKHQDWIWRELDEYTTEEIERWEESHEPRAAIYGKGGSGYWAPEMRVESCGRRRGLSRQGRKSDQKNLQSIKYHALQDVSCSLIIGRKTLLILLYSSWNNPKLKVTYETDSRLGINTESDASTDKDHANPRVSGYQFTLRHILAKNGEEKRQ
jgi:hypothetical protein